MLDIPTAQEEIAHEEVPGKVAVPLAVAEESGNTKDEQEGQNDPASGRAVEPAEETAAHPVAERHRGIVHS